MGGTGVRIANSGPRAPCGTILCADPPGASLDGRASLRHVERQMQFGVAIGLIEQCIRAYEESVYDETPLASAQLLAAVGTATHGLRSGCSNIHPHAAHVDDIFAKLQRTGRHYALRKNLPYDGRGASELDIFGICVENDDFISYECHEVKTLRRWKHHDRGVEQIGSWMDYMHSRFQVPYSRMRGYLWLPSERGLVGQTRYAPEVIAKGNGFN